MRFGAEGISSAKGQPVPRLRVVGMAGAMALLLAGCSSSYNPVNWFSDDPPKPQQIALPADANAEADLQRGLSADGGDRKYASGGERADVTVVRPLRNAPPPNVTVGATSASAGESRDAAVASAQDLPGQVPAAPSLGQSSTPLVSGDDNTTIQGLDAFSPESYSLSMLAATVPFNHGSANLSASDMALLRQVVAQHKTVGGVVTVVGHASSRTGDMEVVEHQLANFDISVRRAEVVARALRRLGVPAKALYVGAVSDNEPIYREVMPAGEAYNRRTEIFLNY